MSPIALLANHEVNFFSGVVHTYIQLTDAKMAEGGHAQQKSVSGAMRSARRRQYQRMISSPGDGGVGQVGSWSVVLLLLFGESCWAFRSSLFLVPYMNIGCIVQIPATKRHRIVLSCD